MPSLITMCVRHFLVCILGHEVILSCFWNNARHPQSTENMQDKKNYVLCKWLFINYILKQENIKQIANYTNRMITSVIISIKCNIFLAFFSTFGVLLFFITCHLFQKDKIKCSFSYFFFFFLGWALHLGIFSMFLV